MFNDPNLVGCTWTDLADRLDTDDTVARWARCMDDLAGVATCEDLVAAWRNPTRTNGILFALGRLAAVDSGQDDDALLVLLHLLSGIVWRLVDQLGDLGRDVPNIVLAELTCQIRTFRWRTWSGSVAATLELQTRRAALDDLLLRDRLHVDRHELQPYDGTVWGGEGEVAAETKEDDLDLVDMLLWAVGQGLCAEDLELLLASERARGTYGHRADDRIAKQRGIARRTLLRRRGRALDALRELAPVYLADVA